MTEQIKQVALRIKELREIAGFSLETMAQDLKIDREIYKQYESGAIDIPISFLYELAQKLKVEMSALLTGENPKLHVYSVVRSGKGASVERRKQYKYQSLASNFIHKKAEPFVVVVEPEPEGTPPHFNSHPGQEFDFMLEGSMKVLIDSHEVILNEGDCIFFDSGYNHFMIALNGKPARFLAVVL